MNEQPEKIDKAKRYRILYWIIASEISAASLLTEIGISVQGVIPNVIGTMLFFLPIELVLWFKSRDEELSEDIRKLFGTIFWFIVICFCSALIVPVVNWLSAVAGDYVGFSTVIPTVHIFL